MDPGLARSRQEEPENLVAVKGEIERRWGTIDLLDILKYAESDTDITAGCCWCC